MKDNIILTLFFIVLLLIFSCNPNLTRDKLNKKDKILWSIYHDYDYCRRIDVFESYTKDWNMLKWYKWKLNTIEYLKENAIKNDYYYFPFSKENLFDYKFNDNYIQFELYDDYTNSFYGYIYNDIRNYCKDSTLLCMGYEDWLTREFNYPLNEWPPCDFTYKEFEEALIRWREICGCDSTINKP